MDKKKNFGDKLRNILEKLGTMVLMNLMFLIAALPIVTIGPAWNALLTAVRYNIRGDKWMAGFKFGYKTRFWRSLIVWVALLLPLYYFLAEINFHWQQEQLVPLLAAVFVFGLLSMFLTALQILNVYVPTSVSRWLHDALKMMKTGFIKVLGMAAVFWLPLFLFLLWTEIFALTVLIFIAVYFTLAALLTTMVLKDNLVDLLLDARTEGVLLAEEGRQKSEDGE